MTKKKPAKRLMLGPRWSYHEGFYWRYGIDPQLGNKVWFCEPSALEDARMLLMHSEIMVKR